MLSMLKLLTTLLLLSSILVANPNEEIEDFLKEQFGKNPAVSKLDVKVVDRINIESMKGWDAVVVAVEATLKEKKKSRKVKQKMIWFTDGTVITKELTDMATSTSLRDYVTPSFKASQYKKENLIYGDVDAEHKVAIFSDPLCPFCRTFVPSAIKYMKKQPNKFALYYYHFPLPTIHPAAIALSKAAIAAELKGRKNTVLDMYTINLNPKERDVKKILAAFNKTMHTDIKPSDLKSKEVIEHFKSDLKITEDLMVQGTPTIFFDGKIDKTKQKFKKVK